MKVSGLLHSYRDPGADVGAKVIVVDQELPFSALNLITLEWQQLDRQRTDIFRPLREQCGQTANRDYLKADLRPLLGIG